MVVSSPVTGDDGGPAPRAESAGHVAAGDESPKPTAGHRGEDRDGLAVVCHDERLAVAHAANRRGEGVAQLGDLDASRHVHMFHQRRC